jgi:hypothetical protein
MSPANGADALVVLYEALASDEQDAAYERIYEARLRQHKVAETELATHVRSLRRVAEAIGHAPGVEEYKVVSRALRAEGEDVQSFASLYKFFACSWPRAREALQLSGATRTQAIEARFRCRRLGRIPRYSEDVLREALTQAAEHYRRPPTLGEFSWWRDRQIELAHAQGEEYPSIPTYSSYWRRWRSWEGALLHFGYTPEEVALRLEQHSQVFNSNADPYLPDDLPVAVLAAEMPDGSLLSEQEARRARETYNSFPRRTRYVLTVRLGLGVPEQTLREAAEPLALHLSRIKQLQVYALDALLHAASDGHTKTRPGLRVAVIEGLRQMIWEDQAGGAHD